MVVHLKNIRRDR